MLGKFLNLLIALLLFLVLFTAIDESYTELSKEEVTSIDIQDIAGPESGGIFTNFVFAFELLSLLLLAALMGALYIAKKEA